MNLFEIESEHFGGEVKVVRPPVYPDDRGSLTLTRLQNDPFSFPNGFVLRQMHTRSHKNVLRGLHYQLNPPMGKLMQVLNGSAYMVAVDIREGSSTFLKYYARTFAASDELQIWAPAGFARGYYALEDNTIVQYNCGEYVGADKAICWNDPDIAIEWPFVGKPILSERDQHAMTAWQAFG